ncbi:hypothetical protein ABIC31_002854 [Paraburkholderia caledonica]
MPRVCVPLGAGRSNHANTRHELTRTYEMTFSPQQVTEPAVPLPDLDQSPIHLQVP